MNTIRIILGYSSADMRRYGAGLALQASCEGKADALVLFPEEGRHPYEHGGIADRLAAHAPVVVATHSEVIVLRMRRLVVEGRLHPEQVLITWLGEGVGMPVEIKVDARGEVSWWPPGVFSEAFEELKGIRAAQKKVDV